MLSDLRAANGLAGDGLHIGQKLVIPSAPKADAVATTATPAPADLTATPAAPTDADASGPVTAPAVATLALPKHTHAAHRLYTVVKGDTLTRIAKRYHTTTSAIMAANNLTNAGRLAIGQKLHIPAHESRASSTAEETTPQETEPHAAPKGQLANYTP
jgi:LysM repeat protein